jgi:hypothetical protein
VLATAVLGASSAIVVTSRSARRWLSAVHDARAEEGLDDVSVLTISYKLLCVMRTSLARAGSCYPCRPLPLLCCMLNAWR